MTNYYSAIVGFETDKMDKTTGLPKVKKSKILIEGLSLFEAFNSLITYLKDDSRGYDIKSITEAKFEDIIKYKALAK